MLWHFILFSQVLAGAPVFGDDHNEDEDIFVDKTTKRAFLHFVDTMPAGILSSPLSQLQILLDLKDAFLVEKSKLFPYELFYERDEDSYLRIESVSNVNVGVAFLGFPQNVIPRIRELWFNDLGRTDELFGRNVANGETVPSSGSIHARDHFHVLETSHYVDDALRKYITRMIRKDSNESKYYLNAWELEAILFNLKRKMSQSPNKPFQTVGIIFVMNIDGILASIGEEYKDIIDPSSFSYSYRNGFSDTDLAEIRSSEDCRAAAHSLIRSTPHNSRRTTKSDPSSLSLNQDIDYNNLSSGNNNVGSAVEINQVKSSKEWAMEILNDLERTPKLSLEERALSILINPSNNPAYASYQQTLARSIIDPDTLRSVAVNDRKGTTLPNEMDPESPPPTGSGPCTFATWAGASGVIWLDLRAAEGSPVPAMGGFPNSHSFSGWTDTATLSEMSRQGSSAAFAGSAFNPLDTSHELQTIRQTLMHYRTHCLTLLSRISPACSRTSTIYELAPVATAQDRLTHFHIIAQQVDRLMSMQSEQKEGEYCGVINLELSLMDVTLEISDSLEKRIDQEDESEGHRIDAEVYYNEVKNFHNRILGEVLEASNVFVGKGHFSRHGFASELINHVMARIANFVLSSTRQLITRPINLRTQQTSKSSYIPSITLTGRLDEPLQHKKFNTAHDTLESIRRVNSAANAITSFSLLGSNTPALSSPDLYGSYSNTVQATPWETTSPPLYIPKDIDLEVYVIRVQSTYEPIDDYEAFNMPMLMREAEKLKLPNQQLTLTVHTLAGDHESSLYFAVNACRRYNIHHNPLERERQHRVLLSGECLWRHLQHVDEDSISNQEKEARARYPLSNKQHMSLFLLSFDDDTPVYLSTEISQSLHQALVFGDSILLVQNKHTRYANGYKCGGVEVYDNLCNPLGAALRAIGTALIGMNTGQDVEDLRQSGVAGGVPCAVSSGSSPLFAGMGTAVPMYSELDLVSAHRGRILRSLDFGLTLKQKNRDEISFHRDLRLESADVYSLFEKALEAVDSMEWSRASALSNALMRVVTAERQKLDSLILKKRLTAHTDEIKQDVLSRSSSRRMWSYLSWLCLSICASSLLTAALFFLFSALIPFHK